MCIGKLSDKKEIMKLPRRQKKTNFEIELNNNMKIILILTLERNYVDYYI